MRIAGDCRRARKKRKAHTHSPLPTTKNTSVASRCPCCPKGTGTIPAKKKISIFHFLCWMHCGNIFVFACFGSVFGLCSCRNPKKAGKADWSLPWTFYQYVVFLNTIAFRGATQRTLKIARLFKGTQPSHRYTCLVPISPKRDKDPSSWSMDQQMNWDWLKLYMGILNGGNLVNLLMEIGSFLPFFPSPPFCSLALQYLLCCFVDLIPFFCYPMDESLEWKTARESVRSEKGMQPSPFFQSQK